MRRIRYPASPLSLADVPARPCSGAQELLTPPHLLPWQLWGHTCLQEEGSGSPVSAGTINGICFSTYVDHLPTGDSARSFAHMNVLVTYGFAVSDATVSAKTISSVCLSKEAQPSAPGGSRGEDELWGGDLIRRRRQLWRRNDGALS